MNQKSAFQNMKEDHQTGDSLRRAVGMLSGKKHTWTVKRVQRTLRSTGKDRLADKISNCRKGQYCGQVYCRVCRDRAARSLKSRISRHIEKRFDGDAELAREQLRHTTILCELVDFGVGSVEMSIDQARKDINALKRRFKNLWFQGSFEFELINIDKLMVWGGKNEVKKKTLGTMADARVVIGNQILVHFHGLMDLNGEDEKLVKKWCRKRWNKHHRQTDLGRIWKYQPLDEMAWKVSSYCFKGRTQDNMTFVAKDFEDGEYFTYEELGGLIHLYDEIGGRNGVSGLLIGFGSE